MCDAQKANPDKPTFESLVRELVGKLYPNANAEFKFDGVQHCVTVSFPLRWKEIVIFEWGDCLTDKQSLSAQEWMTLATYLMDIKRVYDANKAEKDAEAESLDEVPTDAGQPLFSAEEGCEQEGGAQ